MQLLRPSRKLNPNRQVRRFLLSLILMIVNFILNNNHYSTLMNSVTNAYSHSPPFKSQKPTSPNKQILDNTPGPGAYGIPPIDYCTSLLKQKKPKSTTWKEKRPPPSKKSSNGSSAVPEANPFLSLKKIGNLDLGLTMWKTKNRTIKFGTNAHAFKEKMPIYLSQDQDFIIQKKLLLKVLLNLEPSLFLKVKLQRPFLKMFKAPTRIVWTRGDYTPPYNSTSKLKQRLRKKLKDRVFLLPKSLGFWPKAVIFQR